MVDTVVGKAVTSLDSATEQGAAGSAKTGESKFDKVRARLLDEQAERTEIPPEVKQVSADQQKVLQAELAQRVEKMGTTTPSELFATNITQAKEGVERLTSRVNALPKTAAFEPIRQRLASVDAQYRQAGDLLSSLDGTQSQGDLVKIQLQMYQLTENLELMSKVVEQVSSGVKSLLQTQV
jgi:hypothetical protein